MRFKSNHLLSLVLVLLVFGVHLCLVESVSAEDSRRRGAVSAGEKTGASRRKPESKKPRKIPAIKNNIDDKSGSGRGASAGKKAKSKSSGSSKKTHGASVKNKKSNSAGNSAKARNQDALASGHGSKFSDEEIERFRQMPFETWESPTKVSELGLPIAENMAQPYPYRNLMRQFDGGGCRHRGHDIGFFGEKNNGIGSVINSAANAVITLIGKTGENTGEFGRLDKRSGSVTRSGISFPRQVLAPGYGIVYPFSTNYGRWRSGMVIVMKVIDGPLKDHTIRYMHMGAIRPDLKVGDTVKAGEHIALMGGTAVLDSWPHLHIDVESPTGRRIDLGPYIGIPESASHCKSRSSKSKSKHSSKKSSSKKGASKSSSHKKSSKTKRRPRESYTQRAITQPPQTRTLDRLG